MTQPIALKIYRGLLALFTAGALVVTFYLPLIGLGYALDASASLQSRAEGLLFVLPSIAGLLLLVGMLPPIRGRALLSFGITASVLALPPIVTCATAGLAGAIGAMVGVAYIAVWWLLVRSKLSPVSESEQTIPEVT